MDRNVDEIQTGRCQGSVALRKESVDRNINAAPADLHKWVALRKESVDRNSTVVFSTSGSVASLSARRAWIEIASRRRVSGRALSLSARRAWIEISIDDLEPSSTRVALRKESVDRNY